MASENFLISQKHVWNETSHLLILMYCVWILAIRRDTQDIQWNVATCREAANVCNERMKHRFLLSSLQLGGRKLCLRNRSHGSPQWWTMPRRQWINAIRWDSVLKALSTTEAKKSSVHASYIRGGQCFENEERHHVFKALSNTEAEDILCV